MITYIVISYIVMFVWCAYEWIGQEISAKFAFKSWVISPIMMPLCLLMAFVNW